MRAFCGNQNRGHGRAPHGARGLKFALEILQLALGRRAPHGARGLKFVLGHPLGAEVGRAPHGARGLKSRDTLTVVTGISGSRPARGAWIEMADMEATYLVEGVAPRTGRVD